jgi:hypothetical protein
MKLLEKIEAIEFSLAEKERISKGLIDANTVQHRALSSKAAGVRDVEFWRQAQKKFRVTGFRDGSEGAVKRVVTLALEGLKTHVARGPDGGWAPLWYLYSRCVHLYLHERHHLLEALLKEEDFQASPGTLTEQILRCIMMCLPLYEAEADDVRALYELCCFERTTYAEEILAHSAVEISAVRRLVDEGLRKVRREISDAAAATMSEASRQIEIQKSEMHAVRSEFERLRGQLEEKFVELQAKKNADDVAKQLSQNVDSRRKSDPRAPAGQRRAEDIVSAAMAPLQTRLDSLSRQLKETRIRLDDIEAPPILSSHANAPQLPPPTMTARKLIEDWQSLLAKELKNSETIGIGSRWLILAMIRHARSIVSGLPALLTTLFRAIPGAEIRHAVASPLWVDGSDWKEHLEFLSTDGESPRLLVLSDFDVAIQETYLVPPLLSWIESANPKNANRIVLVPCNDAGSISARTYEISLVMPSQSEHLAELARIGDGLKELPSTVDIAQSPLDILAYTKLTNARYEGQLRQLASNYGISLPRRVGENFTNLFEGLLVSAHARDAGRLAHFSCVNSWVESSRGEVVARTLQEALKAALGNAQ